MLSNLVSGFPNSVQSVQGLSASPESSSWSPLDFYTRPEKLSAVTPRFKQVAAAS
jgi:hypothetical protein